MTQLSHMRSLYFTEVHAIVAQFRTKSRNNRFIEKGQRKMGEWALGIEVLIFTMPHAPCPLRLAH
ncbi:MAG: hypothetical protein N2235_16460 [Fischerella sp.]|nr:hypothetical protein [Fischerella sp.]